MSLFKTDLTKKRQNVLKSAAKKQLLERAVATFLRPAAVDWMAHFDGAVSVTTVVVHDGRNVDIYAVDKVPLLFELDKGTILPTVYFVTKFPESVIMFTVQAGAYDKVVEGADLYLPGIVLMPVEFSNPAFSQFAINTPCSVVVENSLTPFAVGMTLMSSQEMLMSSRGKVVKILHVHHDYLWKLGPQLSEANEVSNTVLPLDALSLSSVTEEHCNTADGGSDELDNDELFRLVVLSALKAIRKEQLPILANVFYGSVVLKSLPENRQILVKHTKWKKFSTLLEHLQDDDLIECTKDSKGIEKIVSIFKDNHQFKHLKALTVNVEEAKHDTVQRPDLTEKFTVAEPLLTLVKCVQTDFKKNTQLSAAELRGYVTRYVDAMQLKRSDVVSIDRQLQKCLGKDYTLNSVIRWPNLFEQLNRFLKPVYELRFNDGFVERHRGKMCSIELTTSKRRGNKTVTLVNNLQQHHIDPADFVKLVQPIVSGSATLNRQVACSEGPQVQVQGDHCNRIRKILLEKYSVKPRFVHIS